MKQLLPINVGKLHPSDKNSQLLFKQALLCLKFQDDLIHLFQKEEI